MRRKNKYLVIFVLAMLMVNSLQVFALESTVSNWAQKEVQEAVNNNMVPDDLMKDFNQPIKRYQYVLLAIKVLEKSGTSIEVVQEHPFPDAFGLEYEKEIAKAYNAGIIKGYPDGTFMPDNPITREEIASLVTNLLLAIDERRSVQTDVNGEYADASQISPWALQYIDYCYAQDILKGVGKNQENLDIIQPKGQATIEQAIVLLYRLAKKEALIIEDIGTIEMIQYTEDGEEKNIESQIINEFAFEFGKPLALLIQQIVGQEGISLRDMTNDSAYITIEDKGAINIVKYEQTIEIVGNTLDLKNEVFKDLFTLLTRTLNDDAPIEELFNEAVSGFEENEGYKISKTLDGNNYFKVFSKSAEDDMTEDENIVRYTFSYKQNVIN